ncbi:hypothetical protein DICPUDRAFT_149602 [Dictyostelium purpureum]|uniref:Uncharacterized protein n=1 Tax=Dictyostelium purpureum TaxID=5786 RepID=F0ZE82_DICPU|nr:uncharacterized protein DICPUDRAFT_149602 [Dictyostelium purpureum]EGC37757.1 hypothetical protein DICPUDRAFT_149602 [Dictyostelium purpureum]|eukprot:XP_003285696.1 hypothetical protein DICPUDRAFT_149602 [Dictyostelium purpureum]
MIEFSITYSLYLNILYIFGRYWEDFRLKKESLGFLAALNMSFKLYLDFLDQLIGDPNNSIYSNVSGNL